MSENLIKPCNTRALPNNKIYIKLWAVSCSYSKSDVRIPETAFGIGLKIQVALLEKKFRKP